MKLLVAGDTLPTKQNEKLFEAGMTEELFGEEVLNLFQEADFKLVNIEGVFTDVGHPIDKSGPSIKTSTKSIKGLLPLGLSAVSLANNHSLDYGVDGLKKTVNVFDEYGIPSFGYGETQSEAKRPFIQEINGIKIGIYACAETEFTIVSEHRAGVNPFDELEICDDISDLREKVDYLIVLYHGMKEQYRYPAPYVRKRCRKLVDKGADLVLCQHSHCIGCMEEYKDGTILYGQGDFMFCRAYNEFRANGLLVSVILPEKKVDFLPVVRDENCIHLADEKEKEEILKGFNQRSKEIQQPWFIENQYDAFSKTILYGYDINSLGIFGSILKKLHLTKLAARCYRKGNDLAQLNALRCEAHRDVYINGLIQRIKGKQ